MIPTEFFFKNPAIDRVLLSPDGSTLAYLRPHEARMNIYVQAVGQSERLQVTFESQDIDSFFWKGNDNLLYFKDQDGNEIYHLFCVRLSDQSNRNLTPFLGARTELIDPLRSSEDELLVGIAKRYQHLMDAYRVNIRTGQVTLVSENEGHIVRWVADHNGNIRCAVAMHGCKVRLLYRKTEATEFKMVLETNFQDNVEPICFTLDNACIIVRSNLNRDKYVLSIFDSDSATDIAVLAENSNAEVVSAQLSPKGDKIMAVTYATWKKEYRFLDSGAHSVFAKMSSLLPNYDIELTSCDDEEQKFIALATNDRNMGIYYLFDRQTGKAALIDEMAPQLEEAKLAPMRHFSIESRDGLTLNCYLTLPPHYTSGRLPTVVNPHGGPWNRDYWQFNPEAQFLANRGYAVCQINFRGSSGYGKNFWAASFKQWGRAMQDDITDVVRHLIRSETSDAQRIAIYGGSYGGYAALAGLAFTPELYCCGIAYAGISDLRQFLMQFPPQWQLYKEMWAEMVGDPVNDEELIVSASPLHNADSIRSPLLIAHGENDARVGIDESITMLESLRKRGIKVTEFLLPAEGHGFRKEKNRLLFYQCMEHFLAEHMSLTPLRQRS